MGMETTVSVCPEEKTETRHLLKLLVLGLVVGRCVDGACDAGRAQKHGGAGVGANKDPSDVVASVKCPQLAPLVPEISKGGKGGCDDAQKHGDASRTARRITADPL